MSYAIRFTPEFNLDLAELDIALSRYPGKAERIIEKLDKNISYVAEMPQMHTIYDDFPIFRRIVIEDYLAFYAVDEDNEVVVFHRLVYGGRDLSRYIP